MFIKQITDDLTLAYPIRKNIWRNVYALYKTLLNNEE